MLLAPGLTRHLPVLIGGDFDQSRFASAPFGRDATVAQEEKKEEFAQVRVSFAAIDGHGLAVYNKATFGTNINICKKSPKMLCLVKR